MRHFNRNAYIVVLALVTSSALLSAEVAKAQSVPQAQYNRTVLYSISSPSNGSAYFTSLSNEYGNQASGGLVIADNGISNLNQGSNAYLWNGAGPAIPLNPALGFPNAQVYATDGVQQVGTVFGNGTPDQAVVWNGSSASAMNLNPTQFGMISSIAYGVKNGQQVGSGSVVSGVPLATLWNGNPASAVLLNPTGYGASIAYATDGVHQVGLAYPNTSASDHAVMWSGTADSMVDLNPSGYSESQAFAVGGNQQAGWGTPAPSPGGNYELHAPLLWTGSANSAVDLTPPELKALLSPAYKFFGAVTGTNGSEQVGYINFQSGGSEAFLWSGTADSAKALPTINGFTDIPYSIDGAGDVFGVGIDLNSNQAYAIEWISTPEPGSLALLGCSIVGLLLRRRNRA